MVLERLDGVLSTFNCPGGLQVLPPLFLGGSLPLDVLAHLLLSIVLLFNLLVDLDRWRLSLEHKEGSFALLFLLNDSHILFSLFESEIGLLGFLFKLCLISLLTVLWPH